MESKTTLTSKDVIKDSSGGDFRGKVMVLSERVLKEKYRESKYQLWYACGGFGCEPDKIGTGVFAICLADGEEVKWRRGDFLGIYNGELTKEQQEVLNKLKEE